jgi:uncharacterized protein with PIN domain
MSLTKKEMKRFLAKETERIIEELLAEAKPADEITLDEIERGVMTAGRKFQARITEVFIEAAERAEKEGPRTCPECGEEMRHHGYRERRMVTRAGEVMVRRRYYYCRACGRGIFPPG